MRLTCYPRGRMVIYEDNFVIDRFLLVGTVWQGGHGRDRRVPETERGYPEAARVR